MEETPEIKRLQDNITNIRQDRVKNAQSVEGDFLVEQEQESIELQDSIANKPFSERVSSGVGAGVSDLAITAIGVEAGFRMNSLQKAMQSEDPTVSTIAGSLLKLSERWDDPNWNARQNPRQRQMIESRIQELGLDIEGPEAESLIASGSQEEFEIISEQIRDNQEKLVKVLEGGNAAAASYLVSSLFDIDALVGVGVFNKITKAKRLKHLKGLVAAGKITKSESKLLQAGSTRLGNIGQGSLAGATAAGITEGTRALLDPTVDEKDVIGAVALTTLMGAGIGGIVKPQRVEEIAEDIATTRLMDSVKKQNPKEESFTYNDAFSFTSKQEGGFADEVGDRGGATSFGISSKFYPKQFAEHQKILKEKGPRAARRYRKAFFKGEFYDKVVDKTMSPAQAKVMFDTAINSGVSTAKRLYKKAGGDVNKFLDLREEFVEKIVKNDSSQSKFLQGWKNRIQSLRDEVQPKSPVQNVDPNSSEPLVDVSRSVGAASTGEQKTVSVSASSEDIQNKVWDFFDDNPEIEESFRTLDDFVEADRGLLPRLSQGIAQKAYENIKKTPFISDYDRLIRDAGNVGRYLAYHTVDSPVGQIVNNRSAAATADLVNRTSAVHYAPRARGHYHKWAMDQGMKRISKDYVWDGHLQFGKELQRYREHLHAGKALDDVHPSIKAASDDLDRALSEQLRQNKLYGVDGFEDVEFIPGYTPRKWRGDKFAELETKKGLGDRPVLEALARGIRAKSPDIDEEIAFAMATAIRRSARNNNVPSPVGSLMTVNASGQTTLEQALVDTGVANSPAQAKTMAEGILYKNSDRGTVRSSRSRINIDMTTPIEGTDKTLLDLIDNDVYSVVDRTIRAQSNHAGMASVGIQARDKESWLRAAVDEAEATGGDPREASKVVDDVFSYFDEGAFAGGAGPVAGRLNKLAIMSFLPQLGITQMAEAGVAMGTGGIRAWTKYVGKTMPDILKGTSADMMQSLHGVGAYAADHRLWVSTDHLDDVDLSSAVPFMRTVDRAMDKGMRGMGYISGFYKVNEMLHATAALTMNNYMVRSIKGNKNAKRLSTMGVDKEFRAIIQDKIDRKVIEFDEAGDVVDMHVEQWNPEELNLLRVVTRRNMDQTVQKARKGEAHAWQYTELGSLFSSLKSFTFTAAQKQLIKNARISDPEAFQMLLATTGTAGLAFAAKQIVNGNMDKLDDPEYIAKGALNWSPLLSPALMALDSFSFLIGADQIPGSPFPMNKWRYGHDGLISIPAGVTALNQLAGLPRIPADLLDGDLSRDSINALKAVPVIGRSYPMVPIFETLDKD